MGEKILEYIIRAKDATSKGLNSAAKGFQGFRAKVNDKFKGLAKNIFSVKGAIVGLTAVAGGLGLALKKSFEFERYETQFKVLIGNVDQAKRHIADLKEFSASTPFQFSGIAKASRQLMTLTDGVLGGKESLRIFGDAAATTGQQIEDVSFWVGRAYSSIQAGKPFGEAAARLQEMGILSGSARNKMEMLAESGAKNTAIWAVLQGELKKGAGGMEELSKTGEGLFSTLKDNWAQALAEFGDQFQDLAKEHIKALSDKLKQLKEDGTIAVWAERAKRALESVKIAVKGVLWTIEKLQAAGKFIERVAAAVGSKVGGGTWSEGWEMPDRWEAEIQDKEDAARWAAQDKHAAAKADSSAGFGGGKSMDDRVREAMEGNKAVAEDQAAKAKENAAKEAEARKAEMQKVLSDLSGEELDSALANLGFGAEEEKKLNLGIEDDRLGRRTDDVAEIADNEAERARALLDEKREHELKTVDLVAQAQRDAMAQLGEVGVDVSEVGLIESKFIGDKLANMMEGLAETLAEVMRSEEQIDLLTLISDNTKQTAENTGKMKEDLIKALTFS